MTLRFQVESAKQEMERELMKELEKRREERYNEEKRREVRFRLSLVSRSFEITYTLVWNLFHNSGNEKDYIKLYHVMLELLFFKAFIRNLWNCIQMLNSLHETKNVRCHVFTLVYSISTYV